MTTSGPSLPTIAEIEAFAREAAPRAWPANCGPAASASLKGFYESTVEMGDFVFVDLFGGARTDVGFEVVLYKQHLVWGATYRGGLHRPEIDVDEAYAVLGRALAQRPPRAMPIRGPRNYSEATGNWSYRHEVEGDFAAFTSLERMYKDGEAVYERITVGGLAGDHATYLAWIRVPSLPDRA